MIGMSAITGKRLSGAAHLDQSVRDILTTPIGSRVMRREYGSDLFNLIDAPVNEQTKPDFVAATVNALNRWEPRLLIQKVTVVAVAGGISLTIYGQNLIDGAPIKIEGITIT